MIRTWKRIGLAVLSVSLLALTACGGAKNESTDGKLKKVTVMLDWTPNTNHTGLYVAKEKGFFKQQGLDVEIIQPGEAGTEQAVAAGKADFGVSYQEGVTYARTQGVPLVSIAAVLQHNTSGFASPVDKHITRPKDFEGKTYGGFGSPSEKPIISSLMSLDGADASKVKEINIGSTDFFTAVKRDIDFSWIYYGWTGIEAEVRGQKLNMIYLTDYSKELDYYTPVLITSEKKIQQDQKTVQAFMNAVSEGYQFAIKDPKASADILIKAVPDLNPELVKKSQEWMSPRYQADAPVWGMQKLEVWQNYANWMKKHKLLEGNFVPGQSFTNDFLPKKENH